MSRENSSDAARITLVLASSSPRRRELASALACAVTVVPPAADEPPPRAGESPEEFVLRVSTAKALEVAPLVSRAIVLSADTAVAIDGRILGKPEGRPGAVSMLRRLRGRTHRVLTAVTVLDGGSGRRLSSVKSSDVTMRNYGDDEVQRYVATETPYDKAGAYAIQDDAFRPVQKHEGCYTNVVGLPLCEVVTLLEKIGAPAPLRPDWRPPAECGPCPLRPAEEAPTP